MELELWEVLTKSLERSSVATLSQSVSNLSYIAAYMAALFVLQTRQLRLSFLCLIGCLLISKSILYDLVNGWQLHVIYSIIYLIAVPYVKQLRVMIALFAMALFNAVMAWDAFNYAHTETYLFTHYQGITALLHLVVIISSSDWRRIGKISNDTFDRLLLIVRNSSSFLHIGHLLRYNK